MGRDYTWGSPRQAPRHLHESGMGIPGVVGSLFFDRSRFSPVGAESALTWPIVGCESSRNEGSGAMIGCGGS